MFVIIPLCDREGLLLVAVAAIHLLAGCTGAVEKGGSAPPPRSVGVVAPVQGPVGRTLTQPATLQGIEEATLYAKTAGYLKAVYVDKGDRVRKGQLLALIESPELGHQRDQARAAYGQTRAATLGAQASKGRARADVAQAGAVVEGKKADLRQTEAAVGKARADLARTEAQPGKLKAALAGAEANVQQAIDEQAQAQAEMGRLQQQVKGAQASHRAAQSGLQKAQADARLQEATYKRYLAIQQKDSGLIAGQQVDEARARMEAAQSEVEASRSRVEAAQEAVAGAEQQLEGGRSGVAAAASRVRAARDRVQAAREDLRLADQDIETGRQQVKVTEAQREAARSQITVAQRQQDAFSQQVPVANAQIQSARMQSESSRSALATAGDLASYARIVAPFDGVVTERLSDPGALVQNAGNQAGARGVVRVVRDRSLRVMIPVPEAEISHIRKGRSAVISVDAYPDTKFNGTVTRFSSAVDPRSRTMLTEIVLPNPDGRLRPGMYARATLTLEIHTGALTIPSEAVMGKEDRFVYRVVDSKARKTPVTVGVDDGKNAEITSGLEPGARVVLVGRDTLVDGATVKAETVVPETAVK